MASEETTVLISIPARVKICHRGVPAVVPKGKVQAHLKHGDCLGACKPATTAASRTATTTQQQPAAANNAVKIYPNPVRDKVNIFLGNDFRDVRKVEVINLAGSVVAQQTAIPASTITIPLQRVQPGTYFIRITGKTVQTYKLVVAGF